MNSLELITLPPPSFFILFPSFISSFSFLSPRRSFFLLLLLRVWYFFFLLYFFSTTMMASINTSFRTAASRHGTQKSTSCSIFLDIEEPQLALITMGGGKAKYGWKVLVVVLTILAVARSTVIISEGKGKIHGSRRAVHA